MTAFGIGTSILLGIQMQGLLTLFRTVNGNIPTSGAEAVAVLMRIHRRPILVGYHVRFRIGSTVMRSSDHKKGDQRDRFIEAARQVGAAEDEAAFKAKLAQIARHKPKADVPNQ